MASNIRIGDRLVGEGCPAFVIAEISANHGGRIEEAYKIIHAAKEIGADAVKLQTYTADTITLKCDKPDFLIPTESAWSAKKYLHSLYAEAYTPWEWHKELFAEARRIGIEIFSSPFDKTAVDLLEALNSNVYKLASPEITDIPLVRRIAATGKPIIFSTGVADLNDIELIISTLKDCGIKDFALLKCTTNYPAPVEDTNLVTIPDYVRRFGCVAGLSDHTLGTTVPLAAVAVGAKIIEKHFCISKEVESVDSFFSADLDEFRKMMTDIRMVEQALGTVSYDVPSSAKKNMRARRSLYITQNMKAGDFFSEANVRSIRPSHGLHPKFYDVVLGKRCNVNLEVGDRLTWDVIEGGEILQNRFQGDKK